MSEKIKEESQPTSYFTKLNIDNKSSPTEGVMKRMKNKSLDMVKLQRQKI